jgi:hypothetical protein
VNPGAGDIPRTLEPRRKICHILSSERWPSLHRRRDEIAVEAQGQDVLTVPEVVNASITGLVTCQAKVKREDAFEVALINTFPSQLLIQTPTSHDNHPAAQNAQCSGRVATTLAEYRTCASRCLDSTGITLEPGVRSGRLGGATEGAVLFGWPSGCEWAGEERYPRVVTTGRRAVLVCTCQSARWRAFYSRGQRMMQNSLPNGSCITAHSRSA